MPSTLAACASAMISHGWVVQEEDLSSTRGSVAGETLRLGEGKVAWGPGSGDKDGSWLLGPALRQPQ